LKQQSKYIEEVKGTSHN